MDMDKLSQWQEFAQKFYGTDFWSGIFDNQSKHFLSSLPQLSQMFGKKADFPRTDIFMNEREIIVLVNLPGLNKHDVKLAVTENRLRIKGVVETPYPSYKNVTTERFHGPFERILELPEVVHKQGISAKFINGVLRVRIPRVLRARATSIDIE